MLLNIKELIFADQSSKEMALPMKWSFKCLLYEVGEQKKTFKKLTVIVNYTVT